MLAQDYVLIAWELNSMMYLMGFKNESCRDLIKQANPDLLPKVKHIEGKFPMEAVDVFEIKDIFLKAGLEFGKDFWMKKVDIANCDGHIFRFKLHKKACFDEIEANLSSSLAYSIDNDSHFDSQTASDIYKVLNQAKFKENKDYSIDFIDKRQVEPYILLGVEISKVYRKIEEYYRDGDTDLFKEKYPKTYDKIFNFSQNCLPTFEEIKEFEDKWKGFFERQGRIQDGLW